MSGATNADKTPLPSSLSTRVFTEQEQQDERQPKGLPCKITGFGQNKTTVMVDFLTDGSYTLPNGIEVPINGTRYMRYPWQIGDMGYVIPSQIDTGPASQNFSTNQSAPFFTGANLSSMAFHPLGNQTNDPPDDPDAVQHNGPNGMIGRDDNKKSQVKVNPTSGAQIQGGGDGQGNYPHSSTAGPSQVTHQSTSKISSTSPTHEVSQDQTVGGNHMVTNSITAGQNVSAGGTMSAPSGSFASGSIGGMGFGGGGFSGLGTSGFGGAIMGFLNGMSGSGGSGAGLTSDALAPNAAADNVGAIGGDLSGTLPNPKVVKLENVVDTNIPQYNSYHAAKTAGLQPGQLYQNPTISPTNDSVLCVMY